MDDEAVSQTSEGDSIEQLGQMAREHRHLLAAVARGEGLTPEEALECVQDVLCALVALDGISAPRPTYELASTKVRVRNAARNYRRLHRRQKIHEPLDADRDAASGVPEAALRSGVPEAALRSEVPEAALLVERGEDLLRLRTCVSELCEIQRAVVMLRLLEERSGEDVAEALGLARGYVDVLVHRAKAALRACMNSP